MKNSTRFVLLLQLVLSVIGIFELVYNCLKRTFCQGELQRVNLRPASLARSLLNEPEKLQFSSRYIFSSEIDFCTQFLPGPLNRLHKLNLIGWLLWLHS